MELPKKPIDLQGLIGFLCGPDGQILPQNLTFLVRRPVVIRAHTYITALSFRLKLSDLILPVSVPWHHGLRLAGTGSAKDTTERRTANGS